MHWLTAFLAVFHLSFPQPLNAVVTHTVGIARNAQDQSIAYIEHHQHLPSGHHLVSYFDQAGAVMVSKSITYPGLPQHPYVIQTDFTSGMSVQTYTTATKIQMVRNLSGVVEKFDFPLDNNTIVDAGFDNFLKDNWQRFKENKPQVFKLAVAGQENLLRVQVTKQRSTNNLAFTIKPKNFFIRLLVPEMQLQYASNGRLLAFQGLTNLNLPGGKNRKVEVKFNYYTSPEKLTRPLPQWVPEQ